MMFRSLSIACLLAITNSLLAQQPPEEALKSFTVADGMQLSLFASEPMFSNPTCMDVDERGRVWVCESVNYRWKLLKKKAPNRPEGDRIVILDDTDGDGKADKVTTFYQSPDLLAPLGIAVSKNPTGPGYKVYVCHSPHLYVFEDNDGDGKADGSPKILLTGFGGVDHDHGIHGIHFGPDGKLYFSVGDQGVKNLYSSNGKNKEPKPGDKVWNTNKTDCQAGTIWRCNTDGSGLELLAHNFRNQYEPAVNSFGTMFVSDNDDDGNQQTRICHVMYGGNYGYWPRNRGDHHWHEDQPGVVHKTLRTGFGSPTGLCWYEGKLLEKAFSGQLSAVSSSPLSPPGREAGGEGFLNRVNPDSSEANSTRVDTIKKPLTPNPSPREGEGNRYEGYLLHTDAGPREVRLFGVRPKGAGYELDRVNLVTSTDNWFRPSDVCVAPDGSIMIADWYDPGVGGHGMGDTTRGRIYRLTPKGTSEYKWPKLEVKTETEIKKMLSSPNLSTSHLAGLMIAEKFNQLEDIRFFESIFKTNPPEITTFRAAQIFSQMWQAEFLDFMSGGCFYFGDAEFVKKPTVDAMVMRMTHDMYTARRSMPQELFDFLDAYIDDKISMALRREMLNSLRDQNHQRFKRMYSNGQLAEQSTLVEYFYKLAKIWDGHDRTYLSALNIACGTDPARRDAILKDFEKHFPLWNDKTAWLVWELRPPTVIAKLGKKLATERMTPLQTELALGALAASSGVDGGESLLKLLSDDKISRQMRAAAVKTVLQHIHGKWSSLKSTPLVQQAIEGLMSDREMLPPLIDLITACERKDYQGYLEKLAYNNEGNPNPVRFAAIAGLGKFRNDSSIKTLTEILNHPEKPETHKEVMLALGAIANTNSLAPLQKLMRDPQADATSRQQALYALSSSRIGSTWLLTVKANNELPAELSAETGRLLRNSPHQDLRNKAMVAFPFSSKIDVSKLPSPSVLAKQLGNAERGKTLVFQNKDLACTKCHGFQGVGGKIGPDLSMIGIKGSKENLFESILTPDKAIADQFVQYVIETKNGVVMTGLVVEETSDYLVLRDANGKDTKLALREIEQRTKSAKSIMPENLASFLTEEELIDVVAYLTTLKSPALMIDRWQVVGPFPSDDKDSGLDKVLGPDTGYSAKATYTGKRGPVEWKQVSTNAAGYLDLAAHHGDDAVMSVSYVYAEIESPQDGWGEIKLGTDDGVNAFFNDRLVLKHRRHEAAEPGKDTVSVEFKKGKNTLLLKVSNGNNPHGVYCTVLTPGSEAAKLVQP